MQTIPSVQTIPSEFPLNRWILIVAVMLAVIFVLPVYAEVLSVHAEEERIVPKLWWKSVLRVLSEVVVGAVIGIAAGVVTVWCGAWLGLKNFRVGMQHNKKAEMYERILEALFAEKDALCALMPTSINAKELSKKEEQIENQKVKRAQEEWGRAITVAKLYLPPESVKTLCKYRKEISEAVKEGGFPCAIIFEIDSVVEKVQQQAEADLGTK